MGTQTESYPVDPRNFESLLTVLKTIKQLGFEGFETSFVNVRDQFEHRNEPYDRLKKTGLKFVGIHVALATYDPQTGIPRWDLLQQVANGCKALGAERLIVSGGSTVHPLALRAKADALTRIAKYCKSVGVGCTYYNHEVEFREKGAQIDGLISQTDASVHYFLDAQQAMSAGANAAEFFARNWRRIDAIRLRAFRPGGAGSDPDAALHEGGNEFAPLAKEIQASGWRGWLMS